MNSNLVIIALTAVLISACSSAPKVADVKTSPQEVPAKNEQTGAATTTGSLPTTDVSSSNLAAQLEELQNKGVYFDFDEYVIKPEYREIIQQQAEFIKANGNAIATLEGNADERGSGEYNLSLGDKRANSVRKSLELLGVPSTQIKAVSFGEERPRLACHEERCWKENRRVDFIVKQNQ